MVEVEDIDRAGELEPPQDGRAARRERNRNAVLDVVMEMFAEDSMFPTIEEASQRSGLSLRSLYRYFADPGELVDAAIKRHTEATEDLFRLTAIGQGPLEERIDSFVAMRVGAYEAVAPVHRASVHNAGHHQRVRDELTKNRRLLREQFDRQFEPELAGRDEADRLAVGSAGDALTQMTTIDLLRNERRLSVAETESTLITALAAILRS